MHSSLFLSLFVFVLFCFVRPFKISFWWFIPTLKQFPLKFIVIKYFKILIKATKYNIYALVDFIIVVFSIWKSLSRTNAHHSCSSQMFITHVINLVSSNVLCATAAVHTLYSESQREMRLCSNYKEVRLVESLFNSNSRHKVKLAIKKFWIFWFPLGFLNFHNFELWRGIQVEIKTFRIFDG